MPPSRPQPTVESVKEGCVRLANQLASLRQEVSGLSEKLTRFKRGRAIPVPASRSGHNWAVDRLRGESVETPEPQSAVNELEQELAGAEIGIASRALLAIGRELDGAVREVRAARATLQAIADDSDLRAEFKDWQNRDR